MAIFSRLFGRRQVKESLVAPAIAAYTAGNPVWTPRNYDSLAEEGYQKNVIAYRCIKEIAVGVASVPWGLFKRRREIEEHPLLDLLSRPNPMEGGAEFFEKFAAFYQIAGNSYIEVNRGVTGKEPLELFVHRPDRMRVIPSKKGLPQGYEYEVNGVKVTFETDPITGASKILHFKSVHPLDDWYGMSPIEAAAYSIDQHNSAAEWNQALLQNGARPSGAFIWESKPPEEERKRIERLLLDNYQSPRNAGKPLVLAGVDWKPYGLSPVDMDFLNAKLSTARDICRAFGVPPVLVVEGEGTYANRQDARLELWEHVIIPLLDRIKDSLNNWLVPMYGDNLSLTYNLDEVSALIPRRVQHRDMVLREFSGGLVTLNEAREALGYEAVEDGDKFDGYSPAPEPDLAPAPSKSRIERKDWIPSGVVNISAEIERPEVNAKIGGLLEDVLEELVSKFGRDVVEEIGLRNSFEITGRVQKFIKTQSVNLIRHVNRTTQKKIQAEIAAAFELGESVDLIAERIAGVFDEAGKKRAEVIALTESTKAAGFGSNEAIIQAGLTQKEWISTLDDATRDTHSQMDGQVVPAEGKFRSPSGDEADHPGGFGSPEENINCRCATVAHFGGEKSKKNMTPDERKALWDAREQKRKAGESKMLPVVKQIFAIQKAQVLERLKAMTGQGTTAI